MFESSDKRPKKKTQKGFKDRDARMAEIDDLVVLKIDSNLQNLNPNQVEATPDKVKEAGEMSPSAAVGDADVESSEGKPNHVSNPQEETAGELVGETQPPTKDNEFSLNTDPKLNEKTTNAWLEAESTYDSFEQIGFKPNRLPRGLCEWTLGLIMKKIPDTLVVPKQIENVFSKAGFEVVFDNDSIKKIVHVSVRGDDGNILREVALSHREAVRFLKVIAKKQLDADAEVVSKTEIFDGSNENMLDVDDTNIKTHYRGKKIARDATAELNKLNTPASNGGQENLVHGNAADPAKDTSNEPVVADMGADEGISPDVDTETDEKDWWRVKDVSEINRSKRRATERRQENATAVEDRIAAKLNLMRERIQVATERQKQIAAAEKAAERAVTQAQNPSENIPTPADAEVARQQLEAELARAMDSVVKPIGVEEAAASSTESAPQSASAEKGQDSENINPANAQETTEPQPTVAETAAPASVESTPQPTAAEAAATSTESTPQPAVPENGADTEEQINSLEARVKALQEAYQNGSYETPEFNQQFPEFAAALAAAGGEKKAAMGLLLTQYYKLNQQLVEQRRKERHEKVAKIGKRFEAEFKITPEQLASIEGIEKLSEAQQKLLFENFTQLTLGNVREEAAALTANLSAEQRAAAVGTYGKALGNAFASIREVFTKSKNALANEKAAAKQVREGGFTEHKELLTQLVESMVENGPQVTEEKGELVIDLVNLSPEERGPDGGEVARAAALLSRESNALARIPAADRATIGVDDIGEKPGLGARFGRWLSTDKAQRARQEQVQNAAAAYESAKLGLTEALRKQGMSDIQIAQRLLEVDIRVSQQQTVMTDPDAIKALSEIENKSFWKETAKSFAKGNGLYFGLGFVGRTALGATGGVFALPLVAAGVASLRSWDSSAALLRERDRNQRAGVKDGEAGALNVVAADSLIEKTELLIKRFNNPEATPEDKQKLLNSLRVRTEYIQDKMLLGRVSYGTKAEAVRAQTELAKKLGEAMAVLAAEEQNFRATMSTRYERLTGKLDMKLERTETQIRDERRHLRVEQLAKSAATASAFAVAGIALGALAEEAGVGNKMSQYIEDAKKKAGAWWGGTPMGMTINGLDELRQLEGRDGSAPAAQVPAPENAPTQPPPTPEGGTSTYTIQRGDTLTKILKEQALGGQNSPTPAQLARFFNSLTTVELQSLGVRSQNPDLIFAGETINTEKLKSLWEAKRESLSGTGGGAKIGGEVPMKLNPNLSPIRDTIIDMGAPSLGDGDGKSLDTVNDSFGKATNGEEVTRVAQESVAADLETKVRAQAIHKQLLSAAGIGNLEWDALSSKKMIDVMNAAAQSDSKDWFEMLFNSPRDGWSPLGAGTNLDIKKLQEMVKLASSESIGIKASPGESVENFMRRLTTKLAEASKLGTLPPGFNGVSEAA